VTLGIQPVIPSTAYGYIKREEESLDVAGLKAYRVSKFVEKPDTSKAREYLANGRYYWNGGIFVATPDTILNEMAKLLPDHARGLEVLEGALGTESFHRELETIYKGLETISFDYGIMEKTKESVYVIPCQCGWSDVGSWGSLYELMSGDHDKNKNKKEGEAVLVNCERSFVSAQGGRVVACLGLKGCLVVDTGDALLVADMENAQDIRGLVEKLRAEGKEDVL
jgi:mannose-1-phosphate guanylyltransferase